MSRNFELMQQLEIYAPAKTPRVLEPDFPVLDDIELGGSATRWAADEALSVVQRIFLSHASDAPRVVAFTGVNHGDGCTGICASVAEIMASNGHGRVCIVDANFRTPALPQLFGTTNHHGLTDALLRDGAIQSFMRPVGPEGLWLISSGGQSAHWPTLLSSEKLAQRFEELRKEFSFILVDTPPVARYNDAVAIGRVTDGVVLVLEAAATRRESAQMATSTLRSANIPILGAVLNKRTFPIPENIYRRL